MILSSNLVWLDDIAKLWAFEVEGSKWQNRQYHTLIALVDCGCGLIVVVFTPSWLLNIAMMASCIVSNEPPIAADASLWFVFAICPINIIFYQLRMVSLPYWGSEIGGNTYHHISLCVVFLHGDSIYTSPHKHYRLHSYTQHHPDWRWDTCEWHHFLKERNPPGCIQWYSSPSEPLTALFLFPLW